MKRLLLVLAWIALACETGREPSEARPSASAPSTAPRASAQSAQRALDQLDQRTAVPLLPVMALHQKQNMREHLAAVEQVVAGVAVGDFAQVERAARLIGFSEQMGQMCRHMGAGAPGFSELALQFHHQADEIGEAARARSGSRVLSELAKTLSRCTGCHERYRQSVVSEAEWAEAVGSAPPAAHPSH